jgi:hypothetical protein
LTRLQLYAKVDEVSFIYEQCLGCIYNYYSNDFPSTQRPNCCALRSLATIRAGVAWNDKLFGFSLRPLAFEWQCWRLIF